MALYSSAERDGVSLPSAEVAVKFGDVLKHCAFELVHFWGGGREIAVCFSAQFLCPYIVFLNVSFCLFSLYNLGLLFYSPFIFAFYRMFQINVKRVLFCCCYLKKACPGYCDFHMTISTLFLFFLFFFSLSYL